MKSDKLSIIIHTEATFATSIMFTRPRYRTYEPLLTQQIRLRNLVRLSAINVNSDDDESDKTSMIYFTLHLSAFAKPIYTSEKLPLKSKVEWSEINCPQVFSNSQKFIVIRVWRQRPSCDDNDQLMFLWGVYFSSLIAVTRHRELGYRENTLLFHIFDDVFSSPDQIVIPSNIVSCDDQQHVDRISSSPLSVDSSSVNFRLSKNNGGTSTPNSSSSIFEPDCSITSIEELKVKLKHQEFPRNEIQSSYRVNRLMTLQELQRKIKQKREESSLIGERICMKSAACLNIDLIKNKPVIYETKIQSGMGRQLSRLLSPHAAPPKPETILKMHEMRKDIECKKFRIHFLTIERDRLRTKNKLLEAKREKLKDENTEDEAMIWNCMRTLSRDSLKTHQEKLFQHREMLTNIRLGLGETRRCLLKELNEIYRIHKNDKGLLCINNIHLPDAESYATSQASYTEISVALGLVSHAVIILARILNMPLRNQIIHDGSRSKIVDNIKILSPSDRMWVEWSAYISD